MLTVLPLFVRLPLVVILLLLNTLVHTTPLIILAATKALIPLRGFRRACSRVLVKIAESWIGVHGLLVRSMIRTRWIVEGVDELAYEASYLVLSNHQSWVDIPVLQKTFNRRVPLLRFFIKSQLIWVPFLGLAWWALDFPFMHRYSKTVLAKHPELRGKDQESTRKACEKFRQIPVSIMNFVEGTRFTTEKHALQKSPFAHLLRPKAGGVAFVLDAMGPTLRSILDVTIVYSGYRPVLMDLLAGRIREIRVQVRQLAIPTDLLSGDYENDAAYRDRFQAWINDLWTQKDALISELKDI